jgi:integrase/recombinase XerD
MPRRAYRGAKAWVTLGHMTTTSVDDVVLRLAASAYLGRYTGTSRVHSEADLRIYLAWCAERDLAPLTVGRQQVELYVRWMQEVRRFKPSTVSRRMAVVTGFSRTSVIDAVLEHSPAEYVRRPRVPNESPVLGLSHLQFEAVLAAARESTNRFDFALVAMLGLLGLRISEASGTDVNDIGEEHGHRVLLVHGKGGKQTLIPLPPAVGRALDQAVGDRLAGPILLNRRDRRMDRHCATRRLHNLAQTAIVRLPRLHPHLLVDDHEIPQACAHVIPQVVGPW